MNIAVFYHCRLSGGGMHQDNGTRLPGVEPGHGRRLFTEQINAVKASGLYEASNRIVIGVNGEGDDVKFAHGIAPDGCEVVEHGAVAESLLPTMRLMQKFAQEHPDFAILFFHSKGATHPNDILVTAWRKCLERHAVWGWRKCVGALEAGYDAAGAHWMLGQSWGVPVWFFGGVFFWVTAKFLLTCPKLPEKNPDNRHAWYYPEHFLGTNNMNHQGPLPKVFQPCFDHPIDVNACNHSL